jgi:hypothetical protein
MTVAERLRQEGEVRGKIQLWQELLANGLLPKDMVEQKITQLNRELEKLTKKSTTYSEH